ncbi:DNA primase family protein [Nocardia neocaledoniensis]|uniref:DNA primase family protein n=1 Tax=Nocardia neocaledoniensis TaxID=236511 RepID=UPI002458902B|nr:phage/plasmid primase, P4 family [Nocardia neocaledoniensis]
MSTDDSTDGDNTTAEPAGEVTGAHLAHLLGKPRRTRLSELFGRELSDLVVGWHRATIGRCDPDPEAEDVLVVPLSGEDEVGTLVTEFLADHGVTPPTRTECREWALADREAGGDGVDPVAELARAMFGIDPDLPVTGDGEPRVCGVPKSVCALLTEDEQAKVKAGVVIPTPRSPLAVARWLTRHRLTERRVLPGGRRQAWMRTLIRIDQTWYHYARPAAGEPPRWIARTDPEWMPGKLQNTLGELWYVHTYRENGADAYKLKWWNPESKSVAEVERALAGLLSAGSGTAAHELPDVYGHAHHAYGRANVLCRNGVLDPATGGLTPTTPLWFSPSVIAADYHHGLDPYADTDWLRMLRTQWPEDPGAVTCLQQWFGYVVSGRTDLQKWMLIIGPSGSGKSIIAEVLGALTGTVVATRLDTLNSQFGLQSLYETGAQLALMSDIRFGSRDSSTAVGTLLGVTGEDEMVIERKHKTAVSARLGVRFHGSANEMPRWSDNSAALQRRALILETTRGFRGTEDEDHGLKQRILDNELGSVLRWAVEGLALLNAAGGTFTLSAHAAELAADMDALASPIRTFVEECVALGTSEDFVDLRELFRVWTAWAEENNTGRGMSQNKFKAALKSLYLDPIRPGQKKLPGGKTGKWLVVWGIRSAEVTVIDRGPLGGPRTVRTGEQPALDPYDR